MENNKEQENKFWNVIDNDGNKLSPRTYSTGITQDEVVKDIIKNFKRNERPEGEPKLTILKGFPGTGKSLIALNFAKLFDKSLIVVPTKNLQHQYENDYGATSSKKILKNDGTPLNISILKGRDNFKCEYPNCDRASDVDLPCTEATDNRAAMAKACKHWSPLYPDSTRPRLDDVQEELVYESIYTHFIQHIREPGCGYYDQFTNFINSDVGIMNSAMFNVELMLGRLPKRDLLIIDEFDYFLDSLKGEFSIDYDRIDRLTKRNDLSKTETTILGNLKEHMDRLKRDTSVYDEDVKHLYEDEHAKKIIQTLADDDAKGIQGIKSLHFSAALLAIVEEHIMFKPTITDKTMTITFFVLKLDEVVKKIFSNFKYVLGMSATIQSPDVLERLYGIKGDMYNNRIINSEKTFLGEMRWHKELNKAELIECSYKNFNSGNNMRSKFHNLMNKCVGLSKGEKTLFHIVSYGDFPSKFKGEAAPENIPYSDELMKLNRSDYNGTQLEKFKRGEIDILYSTKDNRGTDLPGDMCRHIIYPKLPYMALNNIFLKALKKQNEQLFWKYYNDKMERELLQGLCRGLRHAEDYVTILSPDIRVYNKVMNHINMKRG